MTPEERDKVGYDELVEEVRQLRSQLRAAQVLLGQTRETMLHLQAMTSAEITASMNRMRAQIIQLPGDD